MILTAQAYQKYVRQTPRKLRLVADAVRDLSLDQALVQLKFTPKKAARTLRQVLLQAQANLKTKTPSDVDKVTIQSIQIEEGPRLKRWQPVSRGRAHPILKRLSHIKVLVSAKTSTSKTKVTKKG